MTKATEYIEVARSVEANTSEIMTGLDNANIPSDQDWENETTTWTFNDGSKIVVCGQDIEVK